MSEEQSEAGRASSPYTLHYTSEDVLPDTDDGSWSVYREEYLTPDAPEPFDGSQEWVSTHASEADADAEANRLQRLITPAKMPSPAELDR